MKGWKSTLRLCVLYRRYIKRVTGHELLDSFTLSLVRCSEVSCLFAPPEDLIGQRSISLSMTRVEIDGWIESQSVIDKGW